MGFQRSAELPAAGRPPLHLPKDGQLVHSKSGSLRRRQLHMCSEKHDDQCHSVQLSNPRGGAEGR